MQFTKLKIEGIVEMLKSAQQDIERAIYMRELIDVMAAPADMVYVANEALKELSLIYDKIEQAKAQLTISGL